MKIEISKETLVWAQIIGSIWAGINVAGLLLAYAPLAWWSLNLLLVTIMATIESVFNAGDRLVNMQNL